MKGSYKIELKKTGQSGPVEYWTMSTSPAWLKLKASLDANSAMYGVSETPTHLIVKAEGGKAKRSKPVSGPRATLPTALKQAACVKAERECVAGLSSHYYSRFTVMALADGKSWGSDHGNPAGRAEFSMSLNSTKGYGPLEQATAFRGPWSDLLTLCRDLAECGVEFQARYQCATETKYVPGYGNKATPTHYAATLMVADREDTNKRLGELVESRRADLVAGEHEYWQEMASLARDHETARKPSESAWTPTELSNGDAWRAKMQPAVVLTGSGLAVMKQRTGYGPSWFVIHAASGKAIHAKGLETVETAKVACLRVRDAVQGIDWNATAAELTAHGPALATRINEAIAA